MTRQELALEARRFVCVLEGLDFKSCTMQHKDKDKDNKEVGKPTYEVRRGPSAIFNASSEEEAKEKADKLNSLILPFIQEEFERLNNKLKEFTVSD